MMETKTLVLKENLLLGFMVGALLGGLAGVFEVVPFLKENEYLTTGFLNIALDNSVRLLNHQLLVFITIAVDVSLLLTILKIRNNLILAVITPLYLFFGYQLNKTSWYPDFLTLQAIAGNLFITATWIILLLKYRLKEHRDIRMLKKIFVAFVGLAVILNLALFMNQRALQGQIKDRPNVILISIDALRADHVGAYGYKENTTPNLDELARKGTIFHNHIADASWTLPAHTAILTSQYPHVIGVEDIYQSIPKSTLTLPEILKNYGYNTKGIISFAFVEPMYGFDQGFDEYDIFNSYFRGEYRDKWYKSSPDITDKAISWIIKNKDKRFFLFLHYFDVHEAYNPPSPFDKRFNVSENEVVNAYDGEIAYTDYHLGRLFSQLSALNLTGNTLIIVTADHGDAFMEHGVYGHEPTVYEEVIQTPLIISLLGKIPEDKVVVKQTQSIDVAPTVLDVLGFPIHKEFSGETLLPLIFEEGKGGRYCTFSRVVSQWYHKETVRTSKYKLIHVYEPLNVTLDNTTRVHSYELYNLEQDPGEKINLIAERPDAALELRTVLDDWVSRGKNANVTGQPIELSEAAKKRLESMGYL